MAIIELGPIQTPFLDCLLDFFLPFLRENPAGSAGKCRLLLKLDQKILLATLEISEMAEKRAKLEVEIGDFHLRNPIFV